MDRPSWAPNDVDLSVANPSRIYDYLVGGLHNFHSDRQAAEALLAKDKNAALYAQTNRVFLRRGVRALLDTGVRQFLDLGSGIPAVGNTHEVAQIVDLASRVCYVAILQDVPNAVAVRGDIRDPEPILMDPAVAGLLDFGLPTAVLMVAVLHFVPDAADPVGIIRRIRDRATSGSYLLVSHLSVGGSGSGDHRADAMADYQARTGEPLVSRSHAEVAALFDVWGDLLDPRIVRVPFWRPEPGGLGIADPDVLGQVPGLAGLARRP